MTAEGYPHDPQCKKCGQPHLDNHGNPGCHGHIYRSDPPIPCRAVCVDHEYGTMCRNHGGLAPQVAKKAKQRRALKAIDTMFNRLGGSIDIDPAEAMLEMVREAAHNVTIYRELVNAVMSDSEESDEIVAKWSAIAQVDVREVWDAHVAVRMYDQERDRLVRMAKMCRDAGVDERLVQIAERQGDWLVEAIDRVLAHLELTETQRVQLPAIMGTVVAELGQGD